MPDFSEKPIRLPTFGRRLLDPHKQQILDWWTSEIRRPNVLINLLQPTSYESSHRTLQHCINRLHQAQWLPPVRVPVINLLSKVIDSKSHPFTPRQTTNDVPFQDIYTAFCNVSSGLQQRCSTLSDQSGRAISKIGLD